ncbi:MOSC domain-containing protein [Pigmentiphaga litoralis]|jgi:uncharacterized protein YcbX|uniref:MOSC domain-containing protein n=1 Tax=Pigmentiphaga litoralis TaxID=516702 RepID=UPI00167B2CE9|nr:MOSC N-terminal beta barrel domain-containing protein [Pigmentiphaga litoralis]GGX25664.1 MOSC domain-containing protein [Pigmentiphaga litoralis]
MTVTVSALYIFPIKSCGGISLQHSAIGMAGLQNDRRWMLVTPDGVCLTQRGLPAMARIGTDIRNGFLTLAYPGMPRLDVPIDVIEDDDSVRLKVTVWQDEVDAVDEGDLAAQWFSAALQTPCRLVKVHPEAHRVAGVDYVGDWLAAHPESAGFAPRHVYAFADGYPVLVANEASLVELNRRLVLRGQPEVGMDRFRPNVVLRGLDAFEEDYASMLQVGDVRFGLVKPCVRCEVPNTDQVTGQRHAEPMTTLTDFRSQQGGGVIFGENAIVDAPAHAVIAVGDAVEVTLEF